MPDRSRGRRYAVAVTEARAPAVRTHQARLAFIVIGLVGVVYAVLALLRLVRFDLTAFDSGIFDNVLWRLGNGYNDVTALTGSHHFSDHMSILMLLAVPVYSVLPDLGLPLLIVAQAVSVALVAVATWLLADHLELSSELRRVALFVVLAGAGAYNAALIDIHEVGLALGPLAMTAVLAVRDDPIKRYWIWPALAAMARIDLAISVLIIGLLIRRKRQRHARIAMGIGAAATTAMGLWLLLNPWGGTSFAFHFSHLGIESAIELPRAVLTNPVAALEQLIDPTMWGTVAVWLAGFMVVPPLRAARWLLPAVPTLIIPVFGSWQRADLPFLHYWHVLLPMLAIATAFGLARTPQLSKRAFSLAIIGVAVSWVFMGMFKPSLTNDITDEKETVAWLSLRPDDSVAAYPTLVPHISTRPTVLQLPTPFACPTLPVASFVGPDQPPDLVALPVAIVAGPANDAAMAVASVLTSYYERVGSFGKFEVWERVREVPSASYSIVCGPGSSGEQ